jgi:hypothetical protein
LMRFSPRFPRTVSASSAGNRQLDRVETEDNEVHLAPQTCE